MNETKLNSITKLTAILTCISLVIGVIAGLIQVRDSLFRANITLEKANQTLDAIKVEALSNVIDILDINSKIRIKQVLFDSARFGEATHNIEELILDGKTGEQIYYSNELTDFREVASHYERLSVLIELNYVEFNVIFDTIAFPDNFWRESKKLRDNISLNWHGKGQVLSDFLKGFTNLCKKYKKERLAHGYKSGKAMVCD